MITNLLENFKWSLENSNNKEFTILYKNIFFGFLMSEDELNEFLTMYFNLYLDKPNEWFTLLHKSLRQTDFFQGEYYKNINECSDDENNLYQKMINERHKYRLMSENHENVPYTEELRKLNKKRNKLTRVGVNGLFDSILYNLINIDYDGNLEFCLKLTFNMEKDE